MPEKVQQSPQRSPNLATLLSLLEQFRHAEKTAKAILSEIFTHSSIENTEPQQLAAIFNTASQWGMLSELSAWLYAGNAAQQIAVNGQASMQEPRSHLPKVANNLSAQQFHTMICAGSQLNSIEHQSWMQQLSPRFPMCALNAPELANIAHAITNLPPEHQAKWKRVLQNKTPASHAPVQEATALTADGMSAAMKVALDQTKVKLAARKIPAMENPNNHYPTHFQAMAVSDPECIGNQKALAESIQRLQRRLTFNANTPLPLPASTTPLQLRTEAENIATSSSSVPPVTRIHALTHNPYAPLWENPDPTTRFQEMALHQVHGQNSPPTHSTNGGFASSSAHTQPASKAPHLGR